MKKLIAALLCLNTFSLFACPAGYVEFSDNMYFSKIYSLKIPIFFTLNQPVSFPIFEDTLELYTDSDYSYDRVKLVSLNGIVDYVQKFAEDKLRKVVSINNESIESNNLALYFSNSNLNFYGDFKRMSQNVVSICYEQKAPIEFR